MGDNSVVQAAFDAAFQVNLTRAVDACPGLIINYIGAQDSFKYEVTAAGDILLKHGAAAAEVADTTIQIGAAAGAIDVSNAAGDTYGEVADHINASANWEAVLCVPRSWSTNGLGASAGNGTLLLKAETTGTKGTPVELLLDSSELIANIEATDVFALALPLGRELSTLTPIDLRKAYPSAELAMTSQDELNRVRANVTAAATATRFAIVGVDKDGNERFLIGPQAGAATTVDFNYPGSGNEVKTRGAIGEQLIAIYTSTVAPTAGELEVHGRSAQLGSTEAIAYRAAPVHG